jgi:hypothetical protein
MRTTLTDVVDEVLERQTTLLSLLFEPRCHVVVDRSKPLV